MKRRGIYKAAQDGPRIVKLDLREKQKVIICLCSRKKPAASAAAKPGCWTKSVRAARSARNHPYINSMYIQLNDGAVQIHNLGRRLWTDPGRKLAAHLLGLPGMIKEDQEVIFDNESLLHYFMRSPYEMPDYSYGFKCTQRNWDEIRKYHYYLVMAREIQRIITGTET